MRPEFLIRLNEVFFSHFRVFLIRMISFFVRVNILKKYNTLILLRASILVKEYAGCYEGLLTFFRKEPHKH